MRLTRPRRTAIAVTLGTVLMLCTLFVAAVRRSETRFGPALTPVMADGVQSWYRCGLTGWLIVQEDEGWGAGGGNRTIERRFRVEPSGLVIALLVTAAAGFVVYHAGRWFVQRRVLRDVCDHCGYSREGLEGPICPECGAPLPGSAT